MNWLFSSPKTIFCHCPYTVEVYDLPSIPASYNNDPDPAASPKAILNCISAAVWVEPVWYIFK